MKSTTPIKQGGYFKSYKEGVCFLFKEIGSFFVSKNTNVSFHLKNDSLSETVLDGYMNSSILAAQLTFNGHFVLHGGLVEINKKQIGILGDSGIGKSTLLKKLEISRDATVYSDDMVAFKRHGDSFELVPTKCSGLRLWEDSLEALSLNADFHEKVHPDFNKVLVPIAEKQFPLSPLKALVILNYGKKTTLEKLNTTDAFKHIMGHLKCKDYLPPEMEGDHFIFASKLAKTTPVYVLTRPMGFENLMETTQILANANFE